MTIHFDDQTAVEDYDDSPWTSNERHALAWEAGKQAGWDEMDEYDRMPEPVSISIGGHELLDRIEPLWLALCQDHADRFPTWRASLLHANFADRKAELLGKAGGGLLVLLGESGGQTIAYCVCTVDHERRGEVDSIYVAPSHQHCGVGTALMNAAMAWLAQKEVQDISVDVMAGNDGAIQLYARFGFQPRTIRLQKA